MAELRFTVLGCGSSPGVPRPNGDWGACDPTEPRNRRRRPSLLVQRITAEGCTTLVIDTGPDFREQMIDAKVTALDGVAYTHAHADHIHGIDDLRTFVLGRQSKLPVYADERTLQRLSQSFLYLFEAEKGTGYPPILIANTVQTAQTFHVAGRGGPITVLPFGIDHGSLRIKGFRMGGLSYCTDASGIPEKTVPLISGSDVLLIDALQPQPHPSHFSFGEALHWIDRLEAKRGILTHMHTPMDYHIVKRACPPHVEPAFDGMVITLEDPD
jgi:phosphoribosyl 1,2-cyclic phosphate phosphodiesterase